MKLELASTIAQSLCHQMRPFVERIEIAGSIRRQKEDVGDIEIVAIPKWSTREVPDGLFGTKEESFNTLHNWAITNPRISWRKTNAPDQTTMPKPDGKHWKGVLLATGIKLDLFMPSAANWGYIFMLRTGSADFMEAVVTHAKKRGTPFVKGFLNINGMPVKTPEEADVFKLLELEWVEPNRRIDRRNMRRLKAGRAKEFTPLATGWNGDNDLPAAQLAARKETA